MTDYRAEVSNYDPTDKPLDLRLSEGLGLAPERARLASCPFAVFDEFGRGADDRVQDYAAALVAAERERCATLLERGIDLGGLNTEPGWQKYTADLLTACAGLIRGPNA